MTTSTPAAVPRGKVFTLAGSPDLKRIFATALWTARSGGGNDLPEVTLVRPQVQVDRDHLARYARVVEGRLTDRLPACYLQTLTFGMPLEMTTGVSQQDRDGNDVVAFWFRPACA